MALDRAVGGWCMSVRTCPRGPMRTMNLIEEKSRHEIITRAKISYSELRSTRTSMRDWINRELEEIGLPSVTTEECEIYGLKSMAHLL